MFLSSFSNIVYVAYVCRNMHPLNPCGLTWSKSKHPHCQPRERKRQKSTFIFKTAKQGGALNALQLTMLTVNSNMAGNQDRQMWNNPEKSFLECRSNLKSMLQRQ